MGIEDSAILEAQRTSVSKEISALWRTDAEKIIDLFQQGNDMVVISARGGSGKSYNLIPQMMDIALERGMTVQKFDCRGLDNNEPPSDFLERKFERRKTSDVVVLDEAAQLNDMGAVRDSLERLFAKGFKVAPIVRSQKAQDREQEAKAWIDASNELGRKHTIYQLEPKQLPRELAERYLAVFDHTPQEVITFILDNFPTYTRLITRLGWKKNIREVIDEWKYIFRNISAGFGIAEEEARLINEKLGLNWSHQ